MCDRPAAKLFGILLSLACLSLGGCTSSDPTEPSALETPQSSATSSSNEFSTKKPPTDEGSLGGGGGGGGGGGRSKKSNGGGGSGGGSGGGGGGGGDDDERSVEFAGPTLDDDYQEYFGNIYLDERSKCSYFENFSEYDVRVDGLSVASPLRAVTGCTNDSDDPDHQGGPGCSVGTMLTASRGNGCTAGVVFESGTDFSRNYTRSLVWRLSVLCTSTATAPCSEPVVVAAEPTPERPVRLRWETAMDLRFCGATDYADESGNPGGAGGPPSDGCSASPAPAESTDVGNSGEID